MSNGIKDMNQMVQLKDAKKQYLLPSLDKRYNKSDVIDCIWRCCGIKTQICATLDCTPRQFTIWLSKYPDAQEEMSKAKEGLINKAEQVILDAMNSDDEHIRLKAAKAILDQNGGPAVQVNINSGNKAAEVQAIFGLGPAVVNAEIVGEDDAAT